MNNRTEPTPDDAAFHHLYFALPAADAPDFPAHTPDFTTLAERQRRASAAAIAPTEDVAAPARGCAPAAAPVAWCVAACVVGIVAAVCAAAFAARA